MYENYNFFKKKKLKVIFGYKVNLKKYISLNEIGADIIFYDQPIPLLPKKLLSYEASKTALICYVPYGFKIANFKQAHFNLELQNYSWKVFAETNWHKDQFVKHSFIKGRNTFTSGYPKLDNYLETKKNTYKTIKNSYLKIIIWAPHWSVNHPINFSTFDKNYIFFKMIVKKYSQFYWIFKPHQRLKYHLEEINFLTKEKINEYYSFWEKLPNGEYYNESDYFDIFKVSDALITDCGSFLAEYLPTRNPILYLVNPHSAGFNEIGKKLVNSYYNAFDDNDIIKFIETVIIKNNDYLKEERIKNLSIVRPNNNGAAKFIVDNIIKELGI
ncbi:CDP-glycerol glycerophosphotransferase family protein, partial [Alphaproteobacteria bacterium]|nr:CDP-glycerol glycerophosphotransferase family protein [Alphaproteobacteria bacterium]